MAGRTNHETDRAVAGIPASELLGEEIVIARSAGERPIYQAIDKIPAWKRWFICQVLRRSDWKVARAYNRIAEHAFNVLGDFDHFDEMRRRGDAAWAKVFDLPKPE